MEEYKPPPSFRKPPGAKWAPPILNHSPVSTLPENQMIGLWVLRLYVAGDTVAGFHAERNVRAVCEEHLGSRYQLDVIDVLQLPEQAKQDEVTVVPVLVRKFPLLVRMIVTDFISRDRLLEALGIPTTA